jgi:hypothetical protein
MREMKLGEWLLANIVRRDFEAQPNIIELHTRNVVGACGCSECEDLDVRTV